MWLFMVTFARVEYGMRRREFFRLTLREWHALRARHDSMLRRRDEMVEFMLAQMIAMQANTGTRSFKEPREPREFMPSAWKAEAAGQPRRRRKESFDRKMRRVMEQAMAYQAGQVTRGIA